jgi:hypothetical protein
MPERFREMEKAALAKGNEVQPSEEEIRPSERGFLRRLREYPELQAKIETMLAIIENAGGDVEKAAEAERRIIEELQQMGNEVLHGWARRQQQKKEEEYNAKPGMNRKEKNPLLVCATGENRNSRTDLHARSAGAADSTVFRIRGSGVPWVFGSPATSHERFWCRSCLCRSREQAESTGRRFAVVV